MSSGIVMGPYLVTQPSGSASSLPACSTRAHPRPVAVTTAFATPPSALALVPPECPPIPIPWAPWCVALPTLAALPLAGVGSPLPAGCGAAVVEAAGPPCEVAGLGAAVVPDGTRGDEPPAAALAPVGVVLQAERGLAGEWLAPQAGCACRLAFPALLPACTCRGPLAALVAVLAMPAA